VSEGANEKSVNWLFSRKPPANNPEPKAPSIVVVIETALPSVSITERWLVPARSSVASSPNACFSSPGGSPGRASVITASGLMRLRRCER
jgi:hypothetical protein